MNLLPWILFLSAYGWTQYYIYKRISLGFKFSPRQKTLLMSFLITVTGLYFIANFIQFIFAIDTYPLLYAGTLWIFGTVSLGSSCFLETGLTLVFPSKTRWWLTGTLVIFTTHLFIMSIDFTYGERIPTFTFIVSRLSIFAFFLLVYYIIYKIISTTLKLNDKRKGVLIILFSTGVILATAGSGIGFLPLIFGFYAVVYARTVHGFQLEKKAKQRMIILLFAGFVLSLPQMTWWGNGLGIPLLYYTGGTWYGLIVMAFTLFLLESGISLFLPSFRRQRVILVLLILAIATGYGLFNGTRVPVVKEQEVPLEKMPENISTFTIVHWSDLHLGDLLTVEWLEKTVRKTNTLEPDLVVITGDLIDKGINNRSLQPYIDSLAQLNAPFGIFAVTGNHEYYNNRIAIFLEITQKVGIHVLKNESVTLSNGIQIAGINDPIAPAFGESRPSVETALKNIDNKKPVILLSHHPFFFRFAQVQGVDLQLSGHTHAGQIPPNDLITSLEYPHAYGLYREGNSYIHTSCGTGLWGIPMRIFSKNEITKITLARSKK